MRSDLGSTADTQPHMDKLTTAEANPQNWTLDWASNSTWGTAHSWQIHGNDKRMHDHSTIIPMYSYDKYIRATVIDYKELRTIQQDTLKLKPDTQATVQPSWRDIKLHTKCGISTWWYDPADFHDSHFACDSTFSWDSSSFRGTYLSNSTITINDLETLRCTIVPTACCYTTWVIPRQQHLTTGNECVYVGKPIH